MIPIKQGIDFSVMSCEGIRNLIFEAKDNIREGKDPKDFHSFIAEAEKEILRREDSVSAIKTKRRKTMKNYGLKDCGCVNENICKCTSARSKSNKNKKKLESFPAKKECNLSQVVAS